MMTVNKYERFSVPQSFEEADLSASNYLVDAEEAGKSRDEFWLIRAPINFDGSLLNDVILDFDGDSVEFPASNDSEKKYEAVCVRELQENESQAPYILASSAEEKRLNPGPAFKGQIIITECVGPSSAIQPSPGLKKASAPKMPEGLRQRFKPFGWEEPWQGQCEPDTKGSDTPTSARKKAKTKKGKKTLPGDDGEGAEGLSLDASAEPMDGKVTNNDRKAGSDEKKEVKKAKKAKRRHEEEEIVPEESIPVSEHFVGGGDEISSPTKKKKKKKKKKSQE